MDKSRKKPVGRRLKPDEPLDPEKIKAIMEEEPSPDAETVTVWPLSAEDALRKALNPPRREGR